jgi:hypothetical protein
LAVAVCAIFLCGINRAVAAVSGPPRPWVFPLQYLIQFDCLDGVRVNPATGTIDLFGHRSNSNHFLHIAYFDYLAEALDHDKPPLFSLDPTTEAYRLIDATDAAIQASLTAGIQNLFDDKNGLSQDAAWYLQKAKVPVAPGLSTREALSRMFRMEGDNDRADMWHAMDQVAEDSGNQKKSENLSRILGIGTAIERIEHAYQGGEITPEQKLDEQYTVTLRAIAQMMLVDSHKYTVRYDLLRQAGSPPQAALDSLIRNDIQQDNVTLVETLFWKIMSAQEWFQLPPWVKIPDQDPDRPQQLLVFDNVSSTSWLGRTLFDADVALKSVVAIDPTAEPLLKAAAPGYESESEFFSTRGFKNVSEVSPGNPYQRATIMPGKFQIAQSADGDAIQFISAPMAIQMAFYHEDATGERQIEVPNPLLDQYATKLSSHYEELAVVFPSLTKVHEAAKIVAVARWLETRGIRIRLPLSGRLTWTPPASVPWTFSRKLQFDPNDATHSMRPVPQAGGVTLTPERNWAVSNGPVAVPSGDHSVAAPSAATPSPAEADLRNRMANTADPTAKAVIGLQLAGILLDRGDGHAAMIELDQAARLNPGNPALLLFSAQSHFDSGDSAGAAVIMQRYLISDPDNAPAQRMLTRFQQQTTGPPANAGGNVTGAAITPFDWNGPVNRSYYGSDRRAPELTDIHVTPMHSIPPPPPPPVPDSLRFNSDVFRLDAQRKQLIQQYYEAPPDKAAEVIKQINAVDADVKKVVLKYQLD